MKQPRLPDVDDEVVEVRDRKTEVKEGAGESPKEERKRSEKFTKLLLLLCNIGCI